MAKIRPIAIWDGEAFVPEPRFKWHCDQSYVVGLKYQIDPALPRSIRSHNHYMVSVEEAWKNLREGDDRFPSADHLRKWALVQCGYCTETVTIYDTKKDARQAAASIRKKDAYCTMQVNGNILYEWNPLSQSVKREGSDIGMDAEVFQKSKTDVLDLLASMINVTRKQLEKQR